MPQEFIGLIRISGKGLGFIETEAGETVEIDPAFLNTALDRDTVRVILHSKRKGKAPLTGEVAEILKRNKTDFVGVIEREDGLYFLNSDDNRMYVDIVVSENNLNGAKEGDKVLVHLDKWTDPKKHPVGSVIEAIGQAGSHEVEMRTIVLGKGFRPEFPPEVESEATEIRKTFATDLAAEIPNRRDIRAITTFTIDPVDAKDFDDALSITTVGDGKLEVGVHIADVSHYVRPDTALDDEAAKRATSIYLVDRTIPMLPEVLSNDACSLVPHQDRLTFGAIFTFDRNYKLVDEWYGKTVIHSDRRFSYEEVQNVLDTQAGDFAEELTKLNEIAAELRHQKIDAGAITFEDEEVKFELDQAGKPLRVVKKVRTDSHKLIEDFMLLANKKVAEYVSRLNKDAPQTFVYRVHDVPDMEKISQLANFLRPLGYNLKVKSDGVGSSDLTGLLKKAVGTPEEHMISRAAVRAMAKAIYSMHNIGHYGLAFTHYTHFTSPIRRYPDLMVHRLLEIYLAGKKPSKEMLEEYAALVVHASDRERLAAEAERDSVRYKQVEYMQDKIGQVYNGIISGITEWGIYVEELETKTEGMVRLRDLKDDFYEFDEANYAMVGKKSKKKYRLGDKVKIKVAKSDLKRKLIDYAIVE